MKPSLTFSMVSGTFVLLVGLTFTLTPTSSLASRPDGYTDNGIPYYYAYPDEGYADEENSDDSSALTMPPDQSMMAPDNEYGYDDSYTEPYDGWVTGWGAYGGFGTPLNQHSFFNNHFHHRNGFVHRDGMRNKFPMHSSIVVPHHNSMARSTVNNGHVMNGAVRSGATAQSVGGAHASGGRAGGGGGHR